MPSLVKILMAQLWLLFFLLTILVVGSAFCVTLYFPLYFLGHVMVRFRPWPDRILHAGIRLLMWIQPWFNAQVRVTVPPGPQGVLLVSNHRSHLDVFILLSRITGIRILAKSTLFHIPFLALMMRASRQIGVERGNLGAWGKAMDEVRLRLRAGERVHVFPEMTRCAPGFGGLQPFTLGPFLAALQEDAVVIPLLIKGTDQVWPKGQLGLNFRKPVEVRTLSPLRARDYSSADQLKGEVQKRIEQALL